VTISPPPGKTLVANAPSRPLDTGSSTAGIPAADGNRRRRRVGPSGGRGRVPPRLCQHRCELGGDANPSNETCPDRRDFSPTIQIGGEQTGESVDGPRFADYEARVRGHRNVKPGTSWLCRRRVSTVRRRRSARSSSPRCPPPPEPIVGDDNGAHFRERLLGGRERVARATASATYLSSGIGSAGAAKTRRAPCAAQHRQDAGVEKRRHRFYESCSASNGPTFFCFFVVIFCLRHLRGTQSRTVCVQRPACEPRTRTHPPATRTRPFLAKVYGRRRSVAQVA